MIETIEFFKSNWQMMKEAPWVFVIFGGICVSIGAAFISWVHSKRFDLLQARLDGKDDEIGRLKNDVTNLDEIPLLKDQVAAMRTELDAASNTDYAEAYRKARNASDSVASSLLDPVVFTANIFHSKVYSDFGEVQRQSKAQNKPIFIIAYDANHHSKSKLKYSAGYFLEYDTTRDLIDSEFLVAILERANIGLTKYLPVDDPLENCRWIVVDVDGQVLRSEGLYANPDEGLKRTRDVVKIVKSSADV